MQLTRGQAARRLGLSIARIRQLQADNTLWSRVDHRGFHMFDQEDIEDLRRKRALARGEDPDGDASTDTSERQEPACRRCGQEVPWLYNPKTGTRARRGLCFLCRAATRRIR